MAAGWAWNLSGPRTLRVDKPYGFIHSMDGMLGLAHAIGTGNVGLLLDCWHWYTGLGTVSDLMALTAEDVVHVHVNDAPAGVDVADQIDNKRALPGGNRRDRSGRIFESAEKTGL